MAIRIGSEVYETDGKTRVRVSGITDKHDRELNGREGVLCRPFRTYLSGVPDAVAGIRLDPIECGPKTCIVMDEQAHRANGNGIMHGCGEQSMVAKRGEFVVIEPGNSY